MQNEKLSSENKTSNGILGAVSCRLLFIENSKSINGYSQLNPMPRALGFKNTYEIQNKLNKYSHLINANDIVTVCEWLFENGYDVVKLNGN